MLHLVNALRDENEGLLSDLETSRTIAAELRCRVVDAEKKLLEKESLGRERDAWLAEKERLLANVKHYKEAASVSVTDVEVLYADLGIAQEDSQKLAAERHWDVGYQAGLKDGYSYSSQGLKRMETPHYNSKARKHLAKLDKEFSGKTPAVLAKITDNPLMSLEELKSLLESAGPSSPKSQSGDDSP
ncbi:hypothetical protein HanRHA438_Chr04g0187961 [Helianthus annuus]|uniref:Uncharacterized protein n=1 Tax=Helianthus annuus TaxID=4232 RepID=A0A9K3JA31_HELAN|nr:hypothetical protein HanXRQr2_Chr04g0178401 [Helianthus annuus]KAJ0589947.1 hypothetical protein HanIR_Chr04g0191991 [Helianthus annuus]KAJ0758474.1 hypothetical protein HanLR1_Chr04g0150861 [Helianthus annuus]KAJ0762134.1 hypothetical protein HanOQP8_Chr04g0158021 [Helianthus annuus]KAJ0927886.1 hypothetical protein HanRHA438_Chr04g0187961 [Helianthus annuus]